MPETRLSNRRKRQRPEQQLPSPPPSKRQKQSVYASWGYVDTPEFWDSLSKIWLTKYALREFDRRNTRPHSSCWPGRGPGTRNSLVKRTSAADFLHNSAPRIVDDVRRFARHGGPDLSDLVAYPEPALLSHEMNSRQSNSNHGSSAPRTTTTPEGTTTGNATTQKTKTSKTSNPADANYQQKLIDGGVFPHGYKYPDGSRPPLPLDWDETKRRLSQARPSLSPSDFAEESYGEFVDADTDAFNEDAVKDTVLPAMLRAIDAAKGAERNILFTNTDPITNGIALAKPDYYYGARPETIDSHVRTKLSNHIIPSKHTHLPAAPNFFLEAKGPDGSLAVVHRQVCHAGAIGARAMQSLVSFGQTEPVYHQNTHSLSATYHGGQLKLYGHSVAQPKGPGTRPEYYMHQLNAYSMTGNKDTFIQGATAFKNAMDLAEEHRNAAIEHANERAQTVQGENQTVQGENVDEGRRGHEDEDEEEQVFHTPPATTNIPEGESSDEAAAPLKRSNRQPPSSPPRQKRRNPGSQQPAPASASSGQQLGAQVTEQEF